MNVQIFVYNCIFRKKEKKNTHKTFHILKMKVHSETHFENENMFLEKNQKDFQPIAHF